MSTNATAAAPSVAASFKTVAIESAARAPRYEIDTSWPKPLPEGWINGQLPCVCVDNDDNIICTNRGDITKEEEETCIKAPAVLIWNQAGDLIDAWGDCELLPRTVHSGVGDADHNIWSTTNGAGMVQR